MNLRTQLDERYMPEDAGAASYALVDGGTLQRHGTDSANGMQLHGLAYVTFDGQDKTITVDPVYRRNDNGLFLPDPSTPGYAHDHMDGISLDESHDIVIKDLAVSGGYAGLHLSRCHNVRVENCSFLGARNGGAFIEDCDNVTFENCLFAGGLSKGYRLDDAVTAPHLGGSAVAYSSDFVEGSRGATVTAGSSSPFSQHGVTFVDCVFAHNVDHNPRLSAVGAAMTVEIVNCVIYNWYNGIRLNSESGGTLKVNALNNLFLTGPNTGNTASPPAGRVSRWLIDLDGDLESPSGEGLYVDGNKVAGYLGAGGQADLALATDIVKNSDQGAATLAGSAWPIAGYAVTPGEVRTLLGTLGNAGAGDSATAAVLSEVLSGQGSIGGFGPGFLTPYA